MTKRHRLLERQIKRHLPAELLEDSWFIASLRNLFESISAAYSDADSDRLMIERSLDLSSQELMLANQEIRALHTIALRIHHDEAKSTSSVYQGVVEEVANYTGFPIAAIKLASNDQKSLEIVARVGLPESFVPSVVDCATVPYAEDFAQGAAYYCDDEHTHFDGEIAKKLRVSSLVAVPISRGGELLGHLSVAHTEKRKSSLAMVRWMQSVAAILASDLNRRMVNEVNQRHQAAVVAQSKMSELGKMAGGVAHEINTPLSTILLLALQMEKAVQDKNLPDFERKLRTIVDTTQRIATIVKGLKTFSRDGSGDPFAACDAAQIVRDTLSLCSERFKHHEVELKIELEEGVQLNARPTQISQMLLNLLNNAFDAALPFEQRWVAVQLRRMGPYVEIAITDCGHGIPHELREKIALPFFTTKAVGSGTGLGLSISTAIAKDHSGSLELDGACVNTRFVIRLPVKIVAAA